MNGDKRSLRSIRPKRASRSSDASVDPTAARQVTGCVLDDGACRRDGGTGRRLDLVPSSSPAAARRGLPAAGRHSLPAKTGSGKARSIISARKSSRSRSGPRASSVR
jgi:hypothetical protein